MLWGWGRAFQRMFSLERTSWPVAAPPSEWRSLFSSRRAQILARLAYPWALAVVVAAGVYLALREGISFTRPPILVALLIAAVMIFTIATQLPPGMYNGHDDFQKYFAYPVRMLQTGTVFGSPLSAMGTQTLGAQAFLDAFVVALFPILYINGVDAVFGLFLCLTLAARFSSRLAMALLCVLSVVFIDPQYANISTLYCGSALIMAVTTAPGTAAVGLLYAALIAMKPTFAVFVAIHLLATFRSVRSTALTSLATAAFLLPWILVHAPHYLAALRTKIPAPTPVVGPVERDSLNLFSFAPLDYGPSAASYTLLIAAMALCGALYFRERKVLAAAASGIATFFILIYVLGPLHAGYEQSLRYFAPVAIGLAPPIFGCGHRWLSVVLAATSLATFTPSVATRAESAWKAHSVWSFASSTRGCGLHGIHAARIKGGRKKETVRTLQEKVPAGETILAWINTPFYLDYKRNRIVDIDPAGIGNPWARVPKAEYLIWDYDGFATRDAEWYRKQALDVGAGERRNAALSLDFMRKMDEMAKAGEVVYDNGEVKVVRLVGRPILAAAAF